MIDATEEYDAPRWPNVPRLAFGSAPTGQFNAELQWALAGVRIPI